MASPFSKLRLAVSCVLIFCSMIVLIPKRPSTLHPMPARSKLWMVKPENMWMERDRVAGSVSEGRQDREGTRRDKGRFETGVKNRRECQAMFTLDKGGEVWVDGK